ncbi:EAL domain-containing protein [Sphingomonas sp. G124]|uniref:EAL domain-containing protein n=1 Tax=Sphingomonas cremea TaxID=2904799 RepID=A0A9X1QL27_9SPHN|nr:EAL domain-containing protein [Sphingomonas cremea]MCF2514499.1 EAL domain-containing protein [Sphingomonas cremea]
MQAAARRSATPKSVGPAVQNDPSSVRASADDHALLAALPIAAAIVGQTSRGVLCLIDRNSRFDEVIALTGDEAMMSGDFRQCQHLGIAQLMQEFLADFDATNELDFCEGEGIGARYFRIKLAPLSRCAKGRPRCLVSLVDRTVEVQAERTLRAEMLRDSLTGLPNRLSFTETIEIKGSTSARDCEYAVLVVDMLRFSRINESMGSLAGDELLITFARRLISALRGGDVLARTGGNEFGILVGLKRGVEDALAAAERIQQVMATPFKLSELEIRIECGIGVALMQAGQDPEELFRNAQFAVKQAKAAGKPQVYEPKEASAARRRFSIETELRRALDKDQLKLFYQPLINLKSGEVAGFEALARWNHEDRGEISPTEFIPVAEESGLILQLGRWAMDKAAQTVAEWDREAGAPLPLYVGVNLSAIQVARDNIADVVESALRSSGLKGERLTLELTESSIVQDPGRAMRVFEALKALDATVAMDDFGTGYSSLAYLQRLPIDVLKIDKSFVTGMMRDPDAVAIVRAVLSLADALGMSTTAEGIETVELATTLAALGCSSGQGFYFARPLEAQAALEYWKSRRRH